MPTTIPTWGYQPDGSAEIFQLAPGECLPDGWHHTPACIIDPANATAEALSARAEGRTYVGVAFDAVSGFRVDGAEPTAGEAADFAGALAEIQRLSAIIETGSAENIALGEEIDRKDAELQKALDLAVKYDQSRTKVEAELDLAAKDIIALRASLEQAQKDGGFAAEERDAALASLDALKAELAQVRADLSAAPPPKPPTKTR